MSIRAGFRYTGRDFGYHQTLLRSCLCIQSCSSWYFSDNMLSTTTTMAVLSALFLLSGSATAQAQTNSSGDAVGTSPTFSKVPPVTAADSFVIDSINQRLSLYNIALDTKTFSLLDGVFTPDIVPQVAVVPINGLPAYESFLASDLKGTRTKHTTDTVFVYDITNSTARSISYSDATYFGQGDGKGKAFAYYERFDDFWSNNGVSGWKASQRSLTFFVSYSSIELRSKLPLTII